VAGPRDDNKFMPITSLTSYFNTTSFGDTNTYTRNQQELALTLDSAVHELANWKSLIAMSAGGGAFEGGRLLATTFLSSVPVLSAIPLLTKAVTFFAGALADTSLTRLIHQAFGNVGEEESFSEQITSQGSVRLLGVLGAGQCFVVIQLLQGLASVSRGMVCGESSQNQQGSFLHHLLMGLQCHFGSGMFAGLTGGVVSAVEARISLRTKNMNVRGQYAPEAHQPLAGTGPLQNFRKTISEELAILSDQLTPHPSAVVPGGRGEGPLPISEPAQSGGGVSASPIPSFENPTLWRMGTRLLEGDSTALADLKVQTDAGYVADAVLTLSHRVEREMLGKDSKAETRWKREYQRLREIEEGWKRYHAVETKRCSSVSQKQARVRDYVDQAKLRGLHFDLGRDLDLLFNWVLIHEYLICEARVLAPFARGSAPSLLGDFLRGDMTEVTREDSGSCVPLAFLTIHLGRQVGLPAEVYFSEEHVSVWLGGEDGFLYNPSFENIGDLRDVPAHPASVFHPRDYFAENLKASASLRHYDVSSLIIERPYDILIDLYHSGRIPFKKIRPFFERGFSYLPDTTHGIRVNWVNFLMRNGCKETVAPHLEALYRHHPESLSVLVQRGAVLVDLGRGEESPEVLACTRRLIEARAARVASGFLIARVSPLFFIIHHDNQGRYFSIVESNDRAAYSEFAQAVKIAQAERHLGHLTDTAEVVLAHLIENAEASAARKLVQDTLAMHDDPSFILRVEDAFTEAGMYEEAHRCRAIFDSLHDPVEPRGIEIGRGTPVSTYPPEWESHHEINRQNIRQALAMLEGEGVGHEDPAKRPTVMVLGPGECLDNELGFMAERYRVILVDFDPFLVEPAVKLLPFPLRDYVEVRQRDLCVFPTTVVAEAVLKIIGTSRESQQALERFSNLISTMPPMPLQDYTEGQSVDLMISSMLTVPMVGAIPFMFMGMLNSRFGTTIDFAHLFSNPLITAFLGKLHMIHAHSLMQFVGRKRGIVYYATDTEERYQADPQLASFPSRCPEVFYANGEPVTDLASLFSDDARVAVAKKFDWTWNYRAQAVSSYPASQKTVQAVILAPADQ